MKHFTHFAALLVAILGFGTGVSGQTQLAAWTFDATAAAPNTPTTVEANLGAQSTGTTLATLYANGTNGSSLWLQASELTTFGGTATNDPRATTVAGNAYTLLGGTSNSANGKSLVFKFSTTGFQDPVITFATRGTSTGFNNHQWAWSTDNVTYTDFGTNTVVTSSSWTVKTLDLSAIDDVDNAATVYIRLTVTGASGTTGTGNNRLDNVVINASPVSAGGPTKLIITSVNGGNSPSANTGFDVVIQAQDDANVPANVTTDTPVTLSLQTGTGALGGTLSGTMFAGSNSVTISGVTYDVAEAGVAIKATAGGLTDGISSTFEVLGAATHMIFVGVPAYGLVASNLTAFTVEARRDNSTVDANYTGDIVLNKETGPGTLSGTLTITAVNGIATFNDLQFDMIGTHSLHATSGVLTGANSIDIDVIAGVQAYRSKMNGTWNNNMTWEAYTGTTWIDAFDLPVFADRDVTIQAGHDVNVPTGYYAGTAKDLIVESGAILHANATSGSCFLYVYGDITNDGTIGGAGDVIGFDIEGASCTLSGSGSFEAARIAKYSTDAATTDFLIQQNMILNYTSSSNAALRNNVATTTLFNITLGSDVQLTVPNAKIDLTGCTLTLQDGASLIDNGTITGMDGTNVTVIRNIAGMNQYHFLASPVNNADLGTVFPAGQHNNIWMRSFDEPSGDWVNLEIPSTLTTGAGYSFFMDVANTTATFTGMIQTADVDLNLSNNNNSGNVDLDGWNLMGNPFASAIQWGTGIWNLTNVNDEVHVWNNGSYKSYVGGAGSLTDGIIPAEQAFFVKANGAAPALTIPIEARMHSAQGFYKNSIDNLLRLDVASNINTITDAAFIRFDQNASAAFDAGYDAHKLNNDVAAPMLYSMTDGTRLSINTLKSIDETSEVLLYFVAGVNGEYTINASGIETFVDGNIMLTDLETNTRQNLSQNSAYTFTANTGDASNRFKLSFATVGVEENQAQSIVVYTANGMIHIQMPEAINARVTISNLTGQVVDQRDFSASNEMSFRTPNTAGLYLVSVSTVNGTTTRKIYVK